METTATTLGTKNWKRTALKTVHCPGMHLYKYDDGMKRGPCNRLLFRANLLPGQVIEIKCPKCKKMQTIRVD